MSFIASLLGALGPGALLRLVPEIIHLFTVAQQAREEAARRKDQNEQEQKMFQLQAAHELAIAAIDLKKTEIQDEAAFRKDAVTATGPLVATDSRWLDLVNGVNALFRPAVSFWFFGIFAAVRTLQLLFLLVIGVTEVAKRSGDWLAAGKDIAALLGGVWTLDDAALLGTILGFWFLDRTIKHLRDS